MNGVSKFILLVALLTLVIPLFYLSVPQTTSAYSEITNGSFETGDFSGWNVTVPPGATARVVTEYDSPHPPPATYSAKQGNYFALLMNGQQNVYTIVSQPFHVSGVGVVISGWSFFKTEDYLPFDDESKVEITVNSGPQILATLFQAKVSTVGNYGGTPWTYWSYAFTSDGDYTIQARITNIGDSAVPSYLGLDAVSVVDTSSTSQEKPRSSPPMPAGSTALIIVKNMNVTPRQAYTGQPITISANMANDGDQGGGYTASLKINGKVEQTKIGAVDGHSAIPVTFTISRSEPGPYTVDIGGQKTTFTILAAKTTSSSPASSGTIVVIIMLVLILSTVVVLMLTFRRPA
jgi:hypothetical protein